MGDTSSDAQVIAMINSRRQVCHAVFAARSLLAVAAARLHFDTHQAQRVVALLTEFRLKHCAVCGIHLLIVVRRTAHAPDNTQGADATDDARHPARSAASADGRAARDR